MDFIAELLFKTTEVGGRKTPAQSGYRPHIKFDFDEMLTSGRQIYINQKIVFPGDTVSAEITILATEHFANKLEVGMPFTFYEGAKVIGTGTILDITNLKLLKK